jgi:hypothetical protein
VALCARGGCTPPRHPIPCGSIPRTSTKPLTFFNRARATVLTGSGRACLACEKRASANARPMLRGLLLAPVVLGAAASTALAASGGCTTSSGLSALLSFMETATDFLIGLGAGGFVLRIAIAVGQWWVYETFIRRAVGSNQHATRLVGGNTTLNKHIQHAFIGLAVLASLLFIRFVVRNFVAGATGASLSGCLTSPLTL